MDDVFLSEVNLDGHENWETVGGNDGSFIPIDSENDTDVLAVQMDIASPLSILKTILGHKLVADLSHFELWLQDVLQVFRRILLTYYSVCMLLCFSFQMKLHYRSNASKEKD